jgi:hypothetical protein
LISETVLTWGDDGMSPRSGTRGERAGHAVDGNPRGGRVTSGFAGN